MSDDDGRAETAAGEPAAGEPAADEPVAKRNLFPRILGFGREIFIFVVIFFVASTVVGRLRAPKLPDVAPTFELRTTTGDIVNLADFRGRPVILNFWATWCGPCRAEIPLLSDFAKDHPDIPVLGIAVDGTRETLATAKEKMNIGYPVLVGTKEVVNAYQAHTVPTTVVVDADGKVDMVHVGIVTGTQLWWATL